MAGAARTCRCPVVSLSSLRARANYAVVLLLVLMLALRPQTAAALRMGSARLATLAMTRPRGSQLRPLPAHWLSRGQIRMSSKPDVTAEASSKYFEFARLETPLYQWWESQGYFKPADAGSSNIDSRRPTRRAFVIPMPPPNVTGYLHMGHAMFVALQDLMARFQRMRGRPTLWLPGTDHAGIATQLLVERSLLKEGTTRQALGREKFLERVWQWKEEKGGHITGQMRRLGASADWSRERFTLEEQMSESVTEAFVRLHERGLIYRGEYMINWSPNLQTAVSDLEVDYSEELGKLYHFKYMLASATDEEAVLPTTAAAAADFIPVATTRPETILGDTAVCVHPDDERYKHFIGKSVVVPFLNRRIPVIADTYVDPAFGTGALKITPAHDVNDYELSKRHQLPLINIFNKDASVNEVGGERYAGLDRFVCRERIWSDLEASGLAIKAEPHMQRIPRSERGGEVIEPLISAQWFARMDNMAARAVAAARDKTITFVPDRFEKVWYSWLENIRDWCVSRQLWWGHRIPVYYITRADGSKVAPEEDYIVARNVDEAMKKAVAKYGDGVSLQQDEDVLDTWFSSGLWPMATVGWPRAETSSQGTPSDSKSDFSRFYPADVMETGYDILFFWVARMVMMGLEFTDKVPFHTIYLHGLVRDAEGQKMSKTKGNVIDPIDTIEQYGCDALRMALLTSSTPGQDVPLSMEKVEAMRNFVNKLWNVGKYIQHSLSSLTDAEKQALAVSATGFESARSEISDLDTLPLADAFIISKVHSVTKEVTRYIEQYEFAEASKLLYAFIWDEFADWYVEISKVQLRSGDINKAISARRTLIYVWDTCLRLLHPFMPFVTETLWQLLPHSGDSIMVTTWPQQRSIDDSSEVLLPQSDTALSIFESLQITVRAVRNARAEYKVEAGKNIAAIIRVANEQLLSAFEEQRGAIALLGRINDSQLQFELGGLQSQREIAELSSDRKFVHLIVNEAIEVFLPMSALVDVDQEIQRLRKQEEKLKKDIASLSARLGSDGFISKAPPKLIEEVKSNVLDKTEQLQVVEKSLSALLSAS